MQRAPALALDPVTDEKQAFLGFIPPPPQSHRRSGAEEFFRAGADAAGAGDEAGARPPPPSRKRAATSNMAAAVPKPQYLLIEQALWEEDVIWDNESGASGDGEGASAAVRCNVCRKSFGAASVGLKQPLPSKWKCARCKLEKKRRDQRERSRAAALAKLGAQRTAASSSTSAAAAAAASSSAGHASQQDASASGGAAAAASAAAAVDRFSLVTPVNTKIESEEWTEGILWDDRAALDSEDQAEPKVCLDLNDPGMLYFVKMPFKSRRFQIHQCKGRHRIPTWKLERMQAALDIRGLNMFSDDQFNISNDRYYCPKQTDQKNEHALKTSYKRKEVVHSRPAKVLAQEFFPTHLTRRQLRRFHRPLLRIPDYEKPLQLQLPPQQADTQARTSSTLRSRKDITARTGHIVLAEYCEEHPTLVQRPGMSTLVRNYECQLVESTSGMSAKFEYGGTTVQIGGPEGSPFLGALKHMESLQAFENGLFRAPVFMHRMAPSDFLVVSSNDSLVVRRVPAIFTVGQLLPKVVVPPPNSRKALVYQRDRLTVAIHRQFRQQANRNSCVPPAARDPPPVTRDA